MEPLQKIRRHTLGVNSASVFLGGDWNFLESGEYRVSLVSDEAPRINAASRLGDLFDRFFFTLLKSSKVITLIGALPMKLLLASVVWIGGILTYRVRFSWICRPEASLSVKPTIVASRRIMSPSSFRLTQQIQPP
eukprot:3380281-Pyramimonas_sp.AAC.1